MRGIDAVTTQALPVRARKKNQRDARIRTGAVYALLLLGALVFSWPLLWMAFTSVKLDRELFARHLHLLPESPQPQRRSPYVDDRVFEDLEGKRQAELLPVLAAHFRYLAPTLDPDLDADALATQLARGAYQHLTDVLPTSQWMVPARQLKDEALASLSPALTAALLARVKRGLVVGQLRARSYDLQEDQLISPAAAAKAWRVQGSAYGYLLPSPKGDGAQWHYDFSEGDRIRLVADLKTSFDLARLYRLQLSLRSDGSWNRLRAYVEMGGKRYEAARSQALADGEWSVLTWQRPGPDDLTNKIRTWTLLRRIDGEAAAQGPHALRVVLELRRVGILGAWWGKISRNYLMVFDNMPFWRYTATSVLLVIANLIGNLLSCSMVAYSFSRLKWPGRALSFNLLLGTMMIPAQVTLIPFFLIIRHLGWYNTLTPLWVCSFFGNAFNVFLMHQFFKGIPRDLEDAAKIDGCGPVRTYWHIMMPLIKPTLATVAVFTFMGVWNDFMGPLIFLSDQRLYPLSLGLYALNVQAGGSMAMMMAGSMLMILPVVLLFFFAQRYFIQGITMTGMKG